MQEEATVIRVENDRIALVELERKSSCRTCCACSSSPGGKMNIEANNSFGAAQGNRVKLDIEAKGLFIGIIMTYLLPALGLIFGIIIGPTVFLKLLFGISLMFLFFGIAHFYARKCISFSAKIVEVIK